MMGQRTRTTAFAVAVVVVAVCTITSCGWFGDEPAEEPALMGRRISMVRPLIVTQLLLARGVV